MRGPLFALVASVGCWLLFASAAQAQRYVEYVRRNQPGRVEREAVRAAPFAAMPLDDAILGVAGLLIDFVYDTIERSRRRSLREMWLAVRESNQDPNVEFRGRIL